MPTDEAPISDQPPREDRSAVPGWLLVVAAFAVVAIPSFVGYLLIRADSTPATDTITAGAADTGSSDMGSTGMGGTPAAPSAALPAGVLPFSQIQATDIVIEADPSGSGAVLRVDTSLDVACAVAFGPTAELGSLATDTDMAGGGHAVHQPLMRGLTDGVTYFYRVQAIGDDGGLYQSGVMQFTYAAADAADVAAAVRPPAPNVASMGRVTASSSDYSDAYSGSNAIDEDLSTEWSSNGDGDDAFIVLEFDDNMIVEGVGFRTREMTDGTAITLSFTVTVDGGTTYGPFEAGPGLAVALVEFQGYEMRFDVETSTGGNTGAVEVEVYGESEM